MSENLPQTVSPQPRELTVQDIVARVRRVNEVMKSVMKEGTHYGTIPGTQKPSLWKPGAEKLCLLLRLAPEAEVVNSTYNEEEVSYVVRVRLRHIATGEVWAEGLGSCSSREEKYAWREAVCKEEFEATDPGKRRVKYFRGKQGSHYTKMQIATDPATQANTVLKMGKKRAFVDASLTASGASDIFTQDVEDMGAGNGDNPSETKAPPGNGSAQAQPKASSQPPEENTLGMRPAAFRFLVDSACKLVEWPEEEVKAALRKTGMDWKQGKALLDVIAIPKKGEPEKYSTAKKLAAWNDAMAKAKQTPVVESELVEDGDPGPETEEVPF